MWVDQVGSLDWEDPLEKGKAIYPLQYSGLKNSMDYCIVHRGHKESDTTERFYLHLHYVQNIQVSIRFLAKNPPVSVKFCCKTLSILLHFTLEFPGSVRFYLRTSQVLSDFTSEPPSLCQILPQNPQVSVRFYLRTLLFSLRFDLKTFKFLSDLTSEPLSFCQI